MRNHVFALAKVSLSGYAKEVSKTDKIRGETDNASDVRWQR
jgi:hypothetical protein